MTIDDPLPHRCLTEDAGVGGRIKVRPEDFVVDEIPLYEPAGEGEHLYLRIQKHGVAHGELLSCLRRTFAVPAGAIGYAGMKDKHAVTRQTVSIHLHKDPPRIDVDHDRIEVLWATRHRNKIRRGHLRGNRFIIRIRDVDPIKTPAAARILSTLERTGVPGYFGSQRFGYRVNNHRLGAMLMRSEWDDAVAELLGATGSPFPEYQRERRELFDAGRLDDAAAHWSTADRSERIAITTLSRGGKPADAIRAIGATTLNFWTSALMSAAFNRVLDRRIDAGDIHALVEGDLAWKHDSRAVFPVTAEDLATGDLDERLARLEISPSGPLWGVNMTRASGAVAEVETEALAATGVTLEQHAASRYRPDGGRRPLRARIEHTDIEGGVDEHGPYIKLVFDLPRGIYATIALREIMKGEFAGRAR